MGLLGELKRRYLRQFCEQHSIVGFPGRQMNILNTVCRNAMNLTACERDFSPERETPTYNAESQGTHHGRTPRSN